MKTGGGTESPNAKALGMFTAAHSSVILTSSMEYVAF